MRSSEDGEVFLQNTSYNYNERGWLKEARSDEFSLKLGYDTLIAQYNGNIASQQWGAGSIYSNIYKYSYDRLNRLTTGKSYGNIMSEVLTYDKMGNIKTLDRDSAGIGTYNYTGNKLNSISGGGLASGSYSYDGNGNATTDGRTGITLIYNYLNLPSVANKTGLSLEYTYDATGNKLKKVSNGVSRHYVAGIEYNGSTIDIIHTEEGLARNNSGTYSYEYNLTDHLGNVRYSFHKDPVTESLEMLQQIDYYPFGKTNFVAQGDNKYLYNGKELQEELGQFDYGARFYDPVVGRFSTIDPLSEISRRISPYNYALNNPMRFVDVDGMYAGEAGNYKKGDRDFEDVLAYFGIDQNHNSLQELQQDPPEKKIKTKDEKYMTDGNYLGPGPLESHMTGEERAEYFKVSAKGVAVIMAWELGAEYLLGRIGVWFAGGGEALTASQMGKIIGWGVGQTPKAVEQTVNLTKNVTPALIRSWKSAGVTREFIVKQLASYTKALTQEGAKLKNSQLVPRKELMETILKIWK